MAIDLNRQLKRGNEPDRSLSVSSDVQQPFSGLRNTNGLRSAVSSSEDIPPLGTPSRAKNFWFQRRKTYEPDEIATLPSVFDDPETAKAYQPRPDWENLHRFDPLARWTWAEELRLVRQLDLRIMTIVCTMFMALELDRSNIQQANADNFLEDLGLTTNDYNFGNTIFKLAFLCAELPSQLVSKWMGPDRWVPIQMILWSIVASSQFWLSGRSSFLACRVLLGTLQGGFIPDMVLYLSYFYKHHELSLRLCWFWISISFADILAGFLGYGLLHLRGIEGLAGWRWLFMIEGLMTLVLGIVAMALMPAGPCQPGYYAAYMPFKKRDEIILVNRVIRDDPSKGTMHNRQPISIGLLLKSLSDYDLWPLYLVGFLYQIPMTPPQQYLTLSLKRIGFSTFQTNLLAIPWVIIHIVLMMALSYSSEILEERALHGVIGQIWVIPFLVYLSVVDITSANKWTVWLIITLLLGYPYAHSIQVGWTSQNSNSVRTRTVSAAVYNMFAQASTMTASNIYREADGPNYWKENRALLGIAVGNVAVYLLTKAYYVFRNKRRERRWSAMTKSEKLTYITATADEGNKRLEFRFVN